MSFLQAQLVWMEGCKMRAALQVQDSLHGGWEESIAFPEDAGAPGLRDLPRF